MPKVSVIVPNYNHARYLPKRIKSVLCQTFQDFELVLLDDRSTDDSRSILSQYAADPRVRLEFNEVNSGSTFKQWNKGISLAQGEYIWLAESDDYADERLLERLVSLLDANPKVVFAYCRSWRISEDDEQLGFADFYLHHLDPHHWVSDFCVDGREESRDYFVFANPVPNASAVVFRRSAYEAVGGTDDAFQLCGDWKLWAAMALTGKVAYVAEPLNYFRFHNMSVRSQTESARTDIAEHLRVVRWVLDHVTVTDATLTAVLRMKANSWVPPLMSFKVPLHVKRSIIKCVRTIDPHPIRSALRPVLRSVQLKVVRHWRSIFSAAG